MLWVFYSVTCHVCYDHLCISNIHQPPRVIKSPRKKQQEVHVSHLIRMNSQASLFFSLKTPTGNHVMRRSWWMVVGYHVELTGTWIHERNSAWSLWMYLYRMCQHRWSGRNQHVWWCCLSALLMMLCSAPLIHVVLHDREKQSMHSWNIHYLFITIYLYCVKSITLQYIDLLPNVERQCIWGHQVCMVSRSRIHGVNCNI
jgi:hypothetical protein